MTLCCWDGGALSLGLPLSHELAYLQALPEFVKYRLLLSGGKNAYLGVPKTFLFFCLNPGLCFVMFQIQVYHLKS